MFLQALVLGSWSIQHVGAIALALGAVVVWGLAIAAGYARHRGYPTKPWLLCGLVTIAVTTIVVIVSWNITEALKRH
jgi:hypothetical protein